MTLTDKLQSSPPSRELDGQVEEKLRYAAMARDECPDCQGSLDTGFECNGCGADFSTEAFAILKARAE